MLYFIIYTVWFRLVSKYQNIFCMSHFKFKVVIWLNIQMNVILVMLARKVFPTMLWKKVTVVCLVHSSSLTPDLAIKKAHNIQNLTWLKQLLCVCELDINSLSVCHSFSFYQMSGIWYLAIQPSLAWVFSLCCLIYCSWFSTTVCIDEEVSTMNLW